MRALRCAAAAVALYAVAVVAWLIGYDDAASVTICVIGPES